MTSATLEPADELKSAGKPLKNLYHERFCLEYAKDKNGSRSYRAAGLGGRSEGAIRASAARLLTRDNIARRIREIRGEVESRSLKLLISDRNHRVQVLQAIHDKLLQVVKERGEDPDISTAPGGKTGVLYKRVKMLGSGPSAYEVAEYRVDTGLLKEIRAHQQQAAQELGQWQEAQAGSVRQLGPGERRLSVTYDEIQQIQEQDPGRWRQIQQMAEAIKRGELAAPEAPAGALPTLVEGRVTP